MSEASTGVGTSPAGTPTVGAESDEQLIAGLAAGRLDALDTLYERYCTMAYSTPTASLRAALAEDVQEAFLGAWRNGRYAEAPRCVRTWLLSIAHHHDRRGPEAPPHLRAAGAYAGTPPEAPRPLRQGRGCRTPRPRGDPAARRPCRRSSAKPIELAYWGA